MHLTIDSREQGRIKSATEYYEQQGLTVEVQEEQVGDYIFQDKVVFEFKTIADFVSSIQSSRVFNQAINQAETYDYHYVIIQGDEASRAKALAMSRNYHEVTYFQYLGAIASLNRYTTVIESYSPFINEAYYRMLITAKKCLQDKPIVKKFPRKDKNSCLNWLCHDVYGINYKTAKKIVDELEINTLEDLFTLEHYRLTAIDGIGDKIADKIMRSIENES
jgi:ERCC4-type nuclease